MEDEVDDTEEVDHIRYQDVVTTGCLKKCFALRTSSFCSLTTWYSQRERITTTTMAPPPL